MTRSSKTATFRRTYAALSSPKGQLVCWEERSGAEGKETPVQFHSLGSVSTQEVIYIHDLSPAARRGKPKDARAESGLLAVHADGHIRLFSENLQKCHWDFVMPAQKAEGTSVAYAASASSASARRAIFSNRTDIAIAEGADDAVLMIVTKSPVAYTVQLVAVPVVAGNRKPRELISLPLPTTDKAANPAPSIFSAHFPTGTLYRLSATSLTTYDLVPAQPAITTTLPIKTSSTLGVRPTSLLHISSSTVLVATDDEIALYDTKFSSLQASVSVQASNPSIVVSRASTPASAMDGASSIGCVFLTTYVQDMDLAMGYSQSGIVGIQLTRSRVGGGLLIDSLGRGIDGAGAPASGRTGKSAHHLAGKQESEKKAVAGALRRLREAKALKNVAAFEAIFAKYVGIQFGPLEKKSSTDGEDVPMVDGSTPDKGNSVKGEASTVDGSFDIPESAYKPLRTDFVMGVLSIIFAVTEPKSVDEEQQMTVAMFAPNVLRYLLESGNFSTLFLPLQEGLMKALLAHDATLRTLQWFLTTLTDLPATEVLSALELALSPTTLAPEGESSVIFEIHRTEVVRAALLRLATFPASAIIKSLRALTSDAIMLLIRLLENELLCEESGEPGASIGIEDIRIVADLLTCALDAVGMSALVMTETTDRLQGLLENVEEALDMVEEAAGLKGLMEELFRHVDWKNINNALPPQPAQEQGEVKEVEKAVTKGHAPAIAKAPSTETTSAPTPAKSKAITLKKQPVVLRKNRHKQRRERFALARTIVGHKKMLSHSTAVSKFEMIKQDRPVALSTAKGVSPILPLGPLALRRIVDPLVGKEFPILRAAGKAKTKGDRLEMRREYWREGLAAGTYSVESMVV